MPRYIVSCKFLHDTLGVVHVSVRANMRRMTAKWKNTEVHISVPPYTTEDEFEKFMRMCETSLPKLRPAGIYTLPMTMRFEDFVVTINEGRAANGNRGCVTGKLSPEGFHIEVPPGTDITSSAVVKAVSRLICSYARHEASRRLLPLARAVAERVGRKPMGWEISNGHRTLGRCSSRGVIALSYVLVLMPRELREYVVCHELAHLSEMNHSARFHKVCDAYCGGREAELEAALKAFRWPIVR